MQQIKALAMEGRACPNGASARGTDTFSPSLLAQGQTGQGICVCTGELLSVFRKAPAWRAMGYPEVFDEICPTE